MQSKHCLIILCLLINLMLGQIYAQEDESERQLIREILIKNGFEDKLTSGVDVAFHKQGHVTIRDNGEYFYQYLINGPKLSSDYAIAYDPNSLKKLSSLDSVVVITHGWIDKAVESWPSEIAEELAGRLDKKKWVSIDFDWRGGSRVVNPTDAARYAREIAGPRLAKTIQLLFPNIKHIHIIAHSAGSWIADTASRNLKKNGVNSIHITLLDAYVPSSFKEYKLGLFKDAPNIWVDHYYTKDFTLASTQRHLKGVFNAELTAIEPGVKEHRFPYRWYYATITGSYGLENREQGKVLYNEHDGLKFGFPRSREFSERAWRESLKIKPRNIKFTKPSPLDGIFKIFDNKKEK